MTLRSRSRVGFGLLSSAVGVSLIVTMTASSAGSASVGKPSTATPPQAAPPGKALQVTQVDSMEVAPGQAGSVTVKVTNRNQQSVLLTRVSGRTTSVTSAGDESLTPCIADWIVMGAFDGSLLIPGRSSKEVEIPVSFDNEPDLNQDNCKGVTYRFSFTVQGRQA